MKRQILLYVAVVAASTAMAWLVYSQMRERAESDPLQDVAFADLDDPLWYRYADREVLLAGARRRIDTMTSTAISAAQVGPVKDEIALLCRHDFVVDLVIESFRRRKSMGVSELSAFMEVFARVKNEKFGELLGEGLATHRFEARINAYEAALTQLHPETVHFLARAYRLRPEGYEGVKVVTALGGINTDDARAILIDAVEEQDATVAVYAIRETVTRGLREAIPALRRQSVEHVDDMVRVTAAWALAEAGQPDGRDRLTELVESIETDDPARAQGIQFLRSIAGKDAIDVFRKLRTEPSPSVVFESEAALMHLRDDALLKEVDRDLQSENQTARVRAVVLLAISGQSEDVERLIREIPRLEDPELQAAFAPLAREKPEGAARFFRRLAQRGGGVGGQAVLSLSEFGEAGLDELEAMSKEKLDREELGTLISALGKVPSARAAEILETIDVGEDRRLWSWLRKNIRAVDLALMKE